MNDTSNNQETTHFGYEEVPMEEKQEKVGQVFRSVANRYDVMNDIMSLGTHRLIKRFTIELSALRPGHKVLDLAGGTGDFSLRFSAIVEDDGQVVLADINDAMLGVGRDRIIDAGKINNVQFAQVNAEELPFADKTFDCICIAYGLRNVTNKDAALKSMERVLKPGGRVVVLEFSKPKNQFIGKAYDIFSSLWPAVGKLITGDANSYNYLLESIRMHPDQEILLEMMKNAGLINCKYHDVLNGICAIRLGFKSS